jgi:hypothetical protein
VPNDRLSSINGAHLDLRRLQTDLITTYKIINNFISLDVDEFFNTAPNSITRGHAFKLFAELILDKKCYYLLEHLPADLVNVNTSNAFKTGLYKLDLSSFLIDI